MLGHRLVVLVVLVLLVLLSAIVVGVVGGPPAAGAAPGGVAPVAPVAPVDGVVVDHFRPPPTPYAAGNRGLDYRVTPLSPVRAAADGEVLFAGQVGGALHVTVRHADGLRSTYSFLVSISVRAGRSIRQGELIGFTGEVFHFGLRDPQDEYLDPEAWLAREPATRVRLVPSGDDGAEAAPGDVEVGGESPWLLGVVSERWRALGTMAGFGASAARYSTSALARRLRFWAHNVYESNPVTHVRRIAAAVTDWNASRGNCTRAGDTPGRVQGRRIVIEIAGIGSTSEQAAVDRVRADELGFAADDVIRFSYNGGAVPDRAGRSGILPTTTYDARDSQEDLFVAGRRLRELVDAVAGANPGVPIDLVAHSQGGVVARLAIEERRAAGLPPAVSHLVTLGTPHEGADLASLVEALGRTPSGDAAITAAQRALGLALDPDLPAAHQLTATSPVIEVLRAHPPPAGVRLTSIAARGDLVVPAGRSWVDGDRGTRTTVPLAGLHAHDELPGSDAATREIALALADRPPTCRGLGTVLVDVSVAESISWAEAVLAQAAPGT